MPFVAQGGATGAGGAYEAHTAVLGLHLRTFDAPTTTPGAPGVPRLPGRAGFMSSPLCMVPPKVKVDTESPPPPPGDESLLPVEKYVRNLQLWRHRASLAVEPLPLRERRASSPRRAKRGARGRLIEGGKGILLIAKRAKDGVLGLSKPDFTYGIAFLRSQDREQQLDDFTQAVRPDAALSREVPPTQMPRNS